MELYTNFIFLKKAVTSMIMKDSLHVFVMDLEKQNFFTLNLILPNNQLAPQNMMPISSVVKGDHSAYFTIVH